MPPIKTDELLDTAQVAARLGVSRRQVQTLIKAGRLPAVKLGRDRFVRAADLAAYVPRPPGYPRGRKRSA